MSNQTGQTPLGSPNQNAVDKLFLKVMTETLERWVRFAEERLHGKGVKLFVMLGNDDEPVLRDVLAQSPMIVDSEDIAVELGDGFQGWRPLPSTDRFAPILFS